MLSQVADDLIELIEIRLSIDPQTNHPKGKVQRLQRIYNSFKKRGLLPYLQYFVQMNENLMAQGKEYHQEYVKPLLLRIRASVEVSREIMMEMLAARISDLKMSYQFSKDSITMLWDAEFDEEKIVQKVKEKFGCLKQFTISFVQKKMEIKISREELVQNYHQIMTKLSELMKEAGVKGAEQISSTKNKTIDLYQNVLRRIKEKERMLMVKAELVEPETEKSNDSQIQQEEDSPERKEPEREEKSGSETQE